MAYHHLALASRDTDATHRFYTEAMGFELVKVVAGKTPGGGWSKHFFYDTGDGSLIAFWEIHDDSEVSADWSSELSKGCGLPLWANHLAFDGKDLEGLESSKRRWLSQGYDVVEIDHGWCRSVYTTDPNGTLVEFCTTTEPFTQADREAAAKLLAAEHPELETPPRAVLHKAKDYSA